MVAAAKGNMPNVTEMPHAKWNPQPAVATVAGQGVASGAPGRRLDPILSW